MIADVSSVIHPISISPDAVLYAIASSDVQMTESLAKQHGFWTSYESYGSLLDDPAVDFVLVAVPPHLRFEWARRALEAGKHVLLQTALGLNGHEARELANVAERTRKILVEVVPSQYHPSVHRLKELVNNGDFGKLLKVNVESSSNILGRRPFATNPRWQYQLGGGSLIANNQTLGICHYILDTTSPEEILQAKANTTLDDPRVDVDMKATLRYSSRGDDVLVNLSTRISARWKFGLLPCFWDLPTITIETEKAEIVFYNVTSPHLFHYIAIKSKTTGKRSYHWMFKGGVCWQNRGGRLWSSQRYQLEAFIDKLRGREAVCWVESEESVATIEVVDEIYRKAGLPVRQSI